MHDINLRNSFAVAMIIFKTLLRIPGVNGVHHKYGKCLLV